MMHNWQLWVAACRCIAKAGQHCSRNAAFGVLCQGVDQGGVIVRCDIGSGRRHHIPLFGWALLLTSLVGGMSGTVFLQGSYGSSRVLK